MKTVIAIPCDSSERNQKFLKQLLASLKHFHPDLDPRIYPNPNPNDKDFWYRATPIIAKQLFDEGYERVIKMDVDQIVLGSLDDILNDTDDYDVGVVLNDPSFPIQVIDIRWPYFNNGLVVMKSKAFVEHWLRLCFSNHFPNYQFREQDLLNILCSDYHNYKVKIFDGDKVYGEFAKPEWINAFLEDGKIYYNVNLPNGQKKKIQLCMYHSGGGNTPDKGNYRIRFSPEVTKYIEGLIK